MSLEEMKNENGMDSYIGLIAFMFGDIEAPVGSKTNY